MRHPFEEAHDALHPAHGAAPVADTLADGRRRLRLRRGGVRPGTRQQQPAPGRPRTTPATSPSPITCSSSSTGTGTSGRGHYVPRPTGTETEVNGDLLIAHSVAALRGHRGASRNDHRARLIARWLVDGEVWVETPRPGTAPGAHGPSFVNEPGGNQQHMVFNAEAVDGPCPR